MRAAFIIFSVLHLIASEDCDRFGVRFYDDIGCSPVTANSSVCPTQFDCDIGRSRNGCLFKGKNYNPAEQIDANLTYSGCQIGCFCQDYDFIICAVLDCAEYLEGTDQNCYRQYELGKCCSTSQVCNVTEEAKKCTVDGMAYEIGQIFYPKDTCLKCICHENFTGTYDEATCEKHNCASQIRFGKDILNKCAPAYFNFHSEVALCCPNYFVCPEKEDDIKMVNFEADKDSKLECQYGVSSKLKLGEGFTRKVNEYGKERLLKCECVVPPLVTCVEG